MLGWPQLEVFPGDIIFGDEDGIVRVDPAIAAEVLVAANEIRQMENGIFAGTLASSMFDAAEARPAVVRKALHERVSWFAFEAAPQTKLRISACSSWHALSAPCVVST